MMLRLSLTKFACRSLGLAVQLVSFLQNDPLEEYCDDNPEADECRQTL